MLLCSHKQSCMRSNRGSRAQCSSCNPPRCRHRSMLSTKQSLTRSGDVRLRSFTCTTEPSPSTSSPIACGQHVSNHNLMPEPLHSLICMHHG